jgi:hypothetical protein
MPKLKFAAIVVQDEDGHWLALRSIPSEMEIPRVPLSSGEVEFVLNRVVFDLQSHRIAEDVAKIITPYQQNVSDKVRKALKSRQNKED